MKSILFIISVLFGLDNYWAVERYPAPNAIWSPSWSVKIKNKKLKK